MEDDIRDLGASLVAVCPQRPEFLKKMQEKHGLNSDIVRDEGNQFAEKMGLRFTLPKYLQEVYLKLPIDLPRMNGEPSWTLAMPARYVIDQSGTIVAADVNPNYTLRPEPQKTLDDLKSIS